MYIQSWIDFKGWAFISCRNEVTTSSFLSLLNAFTVIYRRDNYLRHATPNLGLIEHSQEGLLLPISLQQARNRIINVSCLIRRVSAVVATTLVVWLTISYVPYVHHVYRMSHSVQDHVIDAASLFYDSQTGWYC